MRNIYGYIIVSVMYGLHLFCINVSRWRTFLIPSEQGMVSEKHHVRVIAFAARQELSIVRRSDSACVFTKRSVVKIQAIRHRVESFAHRSFNPFGLERGERGRLEQPKALKWFRLVC
jgi:hypothetical protein